MNYTNLKFNSKGFKNDEKFVSVLVQGSGTFGVESVIQTVNSHNKSNFLVLENGAYGQRMSNICKRLKIPVQTENFAEDAELNIHSIEKILQTKRKFTHVV
jgi:2-aminoethylphosphonate-pyruvate transaminase